MLRIACLCIVAIFALALCGNLDAAPRAGNCPNGNCPNAAVVGASFVLPTQTVSYVETRAPVDSSHELLIEINKTRASRGLSLLPSRRNNDAAMLAQQTRVERSTARVATVTTSSRSVQSAPAQANGPVRRLFAWLFH